MARMFKAGRMLPGAIAMVLLLAAAGCGGTGSEDSTSPSGPPQAGTYAGQTSQGLPITFTVTETGSVGEISFGWRATCEDGQVHTNSIALGGAPIRHDVFAAGGTLETGGIAHVDGEFEGSEASGHLSRSKGSAFGTDCLATGISWHAEFDPSAGEPDGVPA